MQRLTFAFLILGAVLAVGCGDDTGEAFNPNDPNDPSDPGGDFDPSTEVRVRAFHAAPGGPALDVLVNDGPIADALAYGESSRYSTAAGGDAVLLVRSDADDEDLFAVEQPLTAGATYTVIVAGGDAGILPVVLTDDNAAPPAGQAKVRVVHAAPSIAEAVDVYVTAPGADIGTATPTFPDVTFATASSYAALPAGTHEIRLTPAGSAEVLVDSGPVELAAGAIRTAVGIESPQGGAPYSAVLLDDTPE
ncbi:MAG: DUF4397 domain-containing protein [Gemmatimonadales bacterium]